MSEKQAQNRSRDGPSRTPFIAAILGNSIIAAAKFVAAAVTGSSAMMAEGIHSVVDSVNNVLMLVGIRRSGRLPDARHPFGYGKELYFWALIVAVVIFGIGGGVSIYEGVHHIFEPAELGDPLWSYGVLLIAFLADGATLIVAYREFDRGRGAHGIWRSIRTSKDPTKFTVLLEDGAATVGVLIAALGVWLTQLTGQTLYDATASIMIGLLLCVIAVVLAVESKGLLLGESASSETVNAIRRTVQTDRDVRAVRDLLTMHLGPNDLLLNLDVQFAPHLDYAAVAQGIKRLESKIRSDHPEVRRIFIEAGSFRS